MQERDFMQKRVINGYIFSAQKLHSKTSMVFLQNHL